MKMRRYQDDEGCELFITDYTGISSRDEPSAYAFVVMISEPNEPNVHTVGLTRAKAQDLAFKILEGLSK